MHPTPQSPDTRTLSPRPGIAERLSRMIQQPTVSAELDERGTAPFEAFVSLLEELYPLVHAKLERERITEFGLLYRWPGSSPAAPVVLMAHYDVVPAESEERWSFPPFSGEIRDGFVHGRGALDDKGPLVVLLDAVENLLAADFVPAREVYLWFGGNEETFGDAAREAARAFRERNLVPWLVLDEGGAVTDAPLPFTHGSCAMIGVGEKGILTARLSARGDGGHASAPPRLTAISRLSRAVRRLSPSAFPARTPRAISRMLRILSERTTGAPRALYRVLAALPPLSARVFARLGGEPAALVRTTVAPTMQTGGTAANVLPARAEVTLNLRIALGETVAGTAARIRRRIADPEVTVTVLEGDDPSPESPTDGPQFALIERALAASYPSAVAVPYVMMAATDSRHFHRFSPATYRFAPLGMSAELRATIHGIDERVAIADLERGERFHRALIAGVTA